MTPQLREALLAEANRREAEWTKAPTMNPPTKYVHPEPLRKLLNDAAAALLGQDGAGELVLLPRDPTYQMAEAMGVKWESGEGFPHRYAAMIAAAPPIGGRR